MNGVPVGKLLNETKLYLKTDESDILDVEKLIGSSKNAIEGVLLHSSESRKCIVNGESQKFANSSDRALVLGEKIFLKGRDNRSVKINGKLTNLNLLEDVIVTIFLFQTDTLYFLELKFKKKFICYWKKKTVKSVRGVVNCCSLFYKENYLALFVFVHNKDDVKEVEINKHIINKLPGHYEPRKVIVLENQSIPCTNHGKIQP